MKVTINKIKRVGTGNLIAYVDLCFGGQLIVKGCKILKGQNGNFVAMPSQKGKDEKYYPIVLFASKETSQAVSDEVLRLASQQDGQNIDWQE